jgi:thiol-disulfide isomerase/thioredoxin
MKRIFLLTCVLIIFAASTVKAEQSRLSADEFKLADYKGKIVYLDFWASWCVPCRRSFPWMNKIQASYSTDQFVIIAVNLDKKRSLADDFLKQYPANFKVVFDPKGKLAKQYQIKGMPSSVIFDRSGKPVSAHTGFFVKKIEEYQQELKQRINQS